MAGVFQPNVFQPNVFQEDAASYQYGGVGHFLYEREMARKLAAITRTVPPPIDRRTAPAFKPMARPYSAPIAAVSDVAAIPDQRMADRAAAAQAATKRRRETEAILLLAS